MEVLFYKNVHGLNKNYEQIVKKCAFLLLNGFWGALRPITNSNQKVQLYLRNSLLDTRIPLLTFLNS